MGKRSRITGVVYVGLLGLISSGYFLSKDEKDSQLRNQDQDLFARVSAQTRKKFKPVAPEPQNCDAFGAEVRNLPLQEKFQRLMAGENSQTVDTEISQVLELITQFSKEGAATRHSRFEELTSTAQFINAIFTNNPLVMRADQTIPILEKIAVAQANGAVYLILFNLVDGLELDLENSNKQKLKYLELMLATPNFYLVRKEVFQRLFELSLKSKEKYVLAGHIHGVLSSALIATTRSLHTSVELLVMNYLEVEKRFTKYVLERLLELKLRGEDPYFLFPQNDHPLLIALSQSLNNGKTEDKEKLISSLEDLPGQEKQRIFNISKICSESDLEKIWLQYRQKFGN